MRLEHLALWTLDLDRLKAFYAAYFGAQPGPRYVNAAKGFESLFLTFEGGARIELMTSTALLASATPAGAPRVGLSHFALSLGDPAAVRALSARLVEDGFPLLDGPRWTGDGYFESVVLDPDGNRIELTV